MIPAQARYRSETRSDRAAALLAFGLWSAAVIAVATATATTATTAAATFVGTLTLGLIVVTGTLLAALGLVAWVPWLVVAISAALAALVTAATATAAVALAIEAAFAALTVAVFTLGWLGRCRSRAAEQAFQPGEEASWFFRWLGSTRCLAIFTRVATLLLIALVGFATGLEGLVFPRLKRLWLAGVRGLRIIRIGTPITTFGPEGRTLVMLWSRVFVVRTVAPAHGGALGLGGRQDFEFGFLNHGLWLR